MSAYPEVRTALIEFRVAHATLQVSRILGNVAAGTEEIVHLGSGVNIVRPGEGYLSREAVEGRRPQHRLQRIVIGPTRRSDCVDLPQSRE